MCTGQIRKSAQRGGKTHHQETSKSHLSECPRLQSYSPMGSYNPPALHFAFQLGGLWLLLRKAIRREGLTLGSPLLFQVVFPQLSQKGTWAGRGASKCFRDSPSEAAESQTYPRNLLRPSSLLSYREPGVTRYFALFILLCVLLDQPLRDSQFTWPQESVESTQNAAQ